MVLIAALGADCALKLLEMSDCCSLEQGKYLIKFLNHLFFKLLQSTVPILIYPHFSENFGNLVFEQLTLELYAVAFMRNE